MIRPEQIPDEVVMAALRAYERSADNDYTTSMYDFAAAIAAAMNAWPFQQYHSDKVVAAGGYGPAALILALPQEK